MLVMLVKLSAEQGQRLVVSSPTTRQTGDKSKQMKESRDVVATVLGANHKGVINRVWTRE